MSMESFAPLMFVGLIIVLLIGFPVAFSLSALGLGCGYFAVSQGWFPASFMNALPLNVFGILSNDLLLAIPFFTLMGTILEKCGLAEDMLDSMGQLFGPVRGGLGYSVIIVGFILGAVTGTVAGQVIAMAMISLPVMMRWNYNMRYATGVLAASGTITQLVPPSLVLVVLADQLGRPVGDMYKGAWGPSILQVLLFAAYTFLLARLAPSHVPGVPVEARTLSGSALVIKCLRGIIPSAVLIFLVLGSMGGLPGINTAICTPTEAGAMGAVGAFVLAAMHKRLTWPLVKEAMVGTMRITAMVVFILIGSRVFSLVFQGVEGGKWIEHLLSGLPGGQTGFLIVVNIFIFFLAFFLDFFEIAFIIIPFLAPVADKLGIDLIWFGVMICVNMQTSFMHPPFGFALFYLRGIADTLFKNGSLPAKVESRDIYIGAIPWVAMQLILVAIVIAFPQSVTAFLDKPQVLDLDKASETLQQMEAGNRDEASGAAPSSDASASAPAGAASDSSAADDDPMKALQESMKRDAAGGAKK
ncbi:MAG: TRAP transporter large permease subunit [Betaproteobacteria bacterium]